VIRNNINRHATPLYRVQNTLNKLNTVPTVPVLYRIIIFIPWQKLKQTNNLIPFPLDSLLLIRGPANQFRIQFYKPKVIHGTTRQ